MSSHPLNMFPKCPAEYESYAGLTHTIMGRKCSVRDSAFGVFHPDFFNLVFCQFRSGVIGTAATAYHSVASASLSKHVLSVVSMRTFAQMCGISAWRVVAGMQDQSDGPNTGGDVVGNPMRQVGFCTTVGTRRSHLPIAQRVHASSPLPAFALWALAGRFIRTLIKTIYDYFEKNGRGIYSGFRHVILLVRLMWLGSFGVQPSFEPFVF